MTETKEYVCLPECKRNHTWTNWAVGLSFAVLASLSLAVGYAVKESGAAQDKVSEVKGDLEVLKTDHIKTTDYISQTLADMKSDIKEIRKNTDDLRIKVK